MLGGEPGADLDVDLVPSDQLDRALADLMDTPLDPSTNPVRTQGFKRHRPRRPGSAGAHR